MDLTAVFVGVVASLCGIIFGYYGFKRNLKRDWQEDGSVRQDIKYIKDSLAEINKKLEKSDERYIDMVGEALQELLLKPVVFQQFLGSSELPMVKKRPRDGSLWSFHLYYLFYFTLHSPVILTRA